MRFANHRFAAAIVSGQYEDTSSISGLLAIHVHSGRDVQQTGAENSNGSSATQVNIVEYCRSFSGRDSRVLAGGLHLLETG
jgi:hypothetical protein